MDWSGCSEVERVPGKVSGRWVVRGTRILADAVLENAKDGFTPEEIASDIYPGMTADQARRIVAYAQDRAHSAA